MTSYDHRDTGQQVSCSQCGVGRDKENMKGWVSRPRKLIFRGKRGAKTVEYWTEAICPKCYRKEANQ